MLGLGLAVATVAVDSRVGGIASDARPIARVVENIRRGKVVLPRR